MFILPNWSQHSIPESVTQIVLKLKSTAIITSSCEQHPECVCLQDRAAGRGDFPLPSSGTFLISQSLWSYSRLWRIWSLSLDGHCQLILTAYSCQLLEDEALWLPLSFCTSWPFCWPLQLWCVLQLPLCRILFSSIGLSKFMVSTNSLSCSVSLLSLLSPSVPVALKLCLPGP